MWTGLNSLLAYSPGLDPIIHTRKRTQCAIATTHVAGECFKQVTWYMDDSGNGIDDKAWNKTL